MNDDGCPHTLEQYVYVNNKHVLELASNILPFSLVFLGSEKYPYKVCNADCI